MGADLSVIPYRINKANWVEKSRTPKEQILAEANNIIENLTSEEIKAVMNDENLNSFPARLLLNDLNEWQNHFTKTGEVLPVPPFTKTWLSKGVYATFEDNGRDIDKFASPTQPDTLIIIREAEWMNNSHNLRVVIGLGRSVPPLAEYLKIGDL